MHYRDNVRWLRGAGAAVVAAVAMAGLVLPLPAVAQSRLNVGPQDSVTQRHFPYYCYYYNCGAWVPYGYYSGGPYVYVPY